MKAADPVNILMGTIRAGRVEKVATVVFLEATAEVEVEKSSERPGGRSLRLVKGDVADTVGTVETPGKAIH